MLNPVNESALVIWLPLSKAVFTRSLFAAYPINATLLGLPTFKLQLWLCPARSTQYEGVADGMIAWLLILLKKCTDRATDGCELAGALLFTVPCSVTISVGVLITPVAALA